MGKKQKELEAYALSRIENSPLPLRPQIEKMFEITKKRLNESILENLKSSAEPQKRS